MSGFKKLTPEEASQHEGLEPQSEENAFFNIRNLFYEWEPWYQAFFINNGANIACASGSLAGLYYSRHLRRILPGLSKMSGMGILLPAALSTLVGGSLSGMTHDFMVTHDILLQKTGCSVCVETRATALQVSLGSLLPFSSCLAGYVLIGHSASFKWIPHKKDGIQGWVKFYYDVYTKSIKPLSIVTLFQMLIAGGLVYLQYKEYHNVLTELERRMDQDKKRDNEELSL